MKAIGGYFELELENGRDYHRNALLLNNGRNALEYILRVRKYRKVYMPYFTCHVILEPFIKLNIDYEFYHIDSNLEPVFNYNKIKNDEGFLYTNYFGIKDLFVHKLAEKCRNLIIDNAQSFFSEPIFNIDTFYSPRKFFGISDGAYLFCNEELNMPMMVDQSCYRMSHLLIRIDFSAEEGYSEFKSNDDSLSYQPIKIMSKLTQRVLSSIDYEQVKLSRIRNFEYLHQHLKDSNQLKIEWSNEQVPMIYPYWTKDPTFSKMLLLRKIYCATYWPNVREWCDPDSLEYRLTSEIVHLPIDQRYSLDDMSTIIH